MRTTTERLYCDICNKEVSKARSWILFGRREGGKNASISLDIQLVDFDIRWQKYRLCREFEFGDVCISCVDRIHKAYKQFEKDIQNIKKFPIDETSKTLLEQMAESSNKQQNSLSLLKEKYRNLESEIKSLKLEEKIKKRLE